MQHPPIVEYVAPQARERGRQQGIREGRQQGAQEAARECILETLTFRLQTEVEQTFRPALEAIDDLQRLKQLFRIAMQVETLQEFTQALNENSE
jgi:hypothetical protein